MNKHIEQLSEIADGLFSAEIYGEADVPSLISALTYLGSLTLVDTENNMMKEEINDALISEVICHEDRIFLAKLEQDASSTSKIDCSGAMSTVKTSLEGAAEMKGSEPFIVVTPMILTALQATPDAKYTPNISGDPFRSPGAVHCGALDGVSVYCIHFPPRDTLAIIGSSREADCKIHLFDFENISFLDCLA